MMRIPMTQVLATAPDWLSGSDIPRLACTLSAETIAACRDLYVPHKAKIKEIVHDVALITGIAPQVILGSSRRAHIARARQIVMYEAHLRGISSMDIGRVIGRDHTTVLHGIRAEAKRRGEP